MKYYNSMFSRSNSIILFLLLQISFAGNAQKGTQSPYSIFGLGELDQGQYVSFASMGGIAVANSDSTIVNSNNPATYAYVSRFRPVFQIGLNGKHSVFSTATSSSSQQHFGLNQFQMGLPIKKNWGAAFGIVPYSFTGYTITNYQVEDGDTLAQYVNEGSGAVTKLFVGLAYKPLNRAKLDTNFSKKDTTYTIRTHVLTIGANGNYLFGSSVKTQSYEYLTSQQAYNSRVNTALRVSDFSADFGFNYQYYFRPAYTDAKMNGSVSIGATYSPGFELRAFQDLFSHTYLGSFYGNSTGLGIFDTVEFVTNYKGAVYIPEQYKVGLEYRMGWKPSKKGERLLRIGAEVNFQSWSDYYENFGKQEQPSYYKDRLALGFGIEYCPVIGNDPSINILSRTNYRFGLNYAQTELTLNSHNLTNYGMTFGLGVPLNINSTNTTINFGASYGNMGTTEYGLINERYLGFYFGLSIIPDRNELWFVKRKYD